MRRRETARRPSVLDSDARGPDVADRDRRTFDTEPSQTCDNRIARLAERTTKEARMFTELTRDLLDLTATGRGDRSALFAMVVDCCCCSSCACLFFCR